MMHNTLDSGRSILHYTGLDDRAALLLLMSCGTHAGVVAQAPEMFEGHSLSEKIDVYSFGILLWECFTGEVPWSDLDSPMQVSNRHWLQVGSPTHSFDGHLPAC